MVRRKKEDKLEMEIREGDRYNYFRFHVSEKKVVKPDVEAMATELLLLRRKVAILEAQMGNINYQNLTRRVAAIEGRQQEREKKEEERIWPRLSLMFRRIMVRFSR